ncbi:hypothetical protein BC830DRAFT_447115 [Chytriomyces sp. MP71]|nr:hypothetical protein BC830DRAFT_447115 [Chytriomyces sp. MP71]
MQGQQCRGRTTVVEIIDSCSCSNAQDHGSIAISLQAMGDLLGGVDQAKSAGVLQGASWQVVKCPAAFGPGVSVSGASPISGSGAGVSLPTVTSTSTASNQGTSNGGGSSTNIGPIIGGVAAGVLGLIVVAFVLWLRMRQIHQQKEDTSFHPSMAFIANSNNNRKSQIHSNNNGTAPRPESAPSTTVPSPEPLANPVTSTNVPSMVSPVSLYGVYPQQQPQAPIYYQQPVSVAYGYPQPQAVSPLIQQQPMGAAQGKADYSQEWAQYFQQHPEEYAKYYGGANQPSGAAPRHQ